MCMIANAVSLFTATTATIPFLRTGNGGAFRRMLMGDSTTKLLLSPLLTTLLRTVLMQEMLINVSLRSSRPISLSPSRLLFAGRPTISHPTRRMPYSSFLLPCFTSFPSIHLSSPSPRSGIDTNTFLPSSLQRYQSQNPTLHPQHPPTAMDPPSLRKN
jgi:hypothetical protein